MSSGSSGSIDALLAEIAGCTRCAGHLPLGPRPILHASQAARILVAGQAPGIRVHQTGIPFNDPSGDRLRDWMGVDRETFYDTGRIAIVPMGFCYPGSTVRGDLPPRPECARQWHPRLIPLLTQVELVLAIGVHAHRYHLRGRRKPTLTETVQHWESYLPDVIPLPHPSPRNNGWLKNNPWFQRALVPEVKRHVAALL